ncbi:MAG: class I SAM-dependent methyltransferase [Desulfobacteraceae bacterium]|jgi:SAM-dependent methyltransferase|nr:class I SAM-dependent methyltransferase [Desulfobacteraceae bacterium]
MPKILPFQRYTGQYEDWFSDHRWVYEAELRAVKALLPESDRGLEVGVGTGRFAKPLGIKTGLEPSVRMREIARRRGIKVLAGVAENLPFGDGEFDLVLMVTTVCFLDDIHQAFQEAHRVLANDGFFIAGIVDRNSPIGQQYLKHQNESVFYKLATFFSVDEVVKIMRQSGFIDFRFRQTIFRSLSVTDDKEPVKLGYGEGSFVVVRGRKEQNFI